MQTKGKEIDLMLKYPKAKRDPSARALAKTKEDQQIARKFDVDFFDGDRSTGYGGFSYNPKYWSLVVRDFQSYYGLSADSKVLDVGCAKGFMLKDLEDAIPGIDVRGIDISQYAINNSHPQVRNKLKVSCATKLPYPDNTFDLVISITTLHNLEGEDLEKLLEKFLECPNIMRL